MPKVTEFITKLVELGCDLEEWSTSPWLSNQAEVQGVSA